MTVSQTPPEPDLVGSEGSEAPPSGGSGGVPPGKDTAAKGPATLITDARIGTSEEMSSRVRRYTITMAFRTACFIAMVFVEGPLRWVLFACAVILPYIAVVAANQAKLRGRGRVEPAEPAPRLQITSGERADVISGSLAAEQESHGKRVA